MSLEEGAKGNVTHRGEGALTMEKVVEESNQKPKYAGHYQKRPGWDSPPEACSLADTVGLA